MFVVGLFVGPFLGFLLARYVLRPAAFSAPLAGAVVVLIAIVILFAGMIPLELKLGVLTGYGLGLLLSGTPLDRAPLARNPSAD